MVGEVKQLQVCIIVGVPIVAKLTIKDFKCLINVHCGRDFVLCGLVCIFAILACG